MVALLKTHLGVVCPSCDFLNVVGAGKCMACGSATEGPGTPAAADRNVGQTPVSSTAQTAPSAGLPHTDKQ